jgi:hypothetical protein
MAGALRAIPQSTGVGTEFATGLEFIKQRMLGAGLPNGSDGMNERYVQADPHPKMVKMQGGVFGAVSDSAAVTGAIA